MFEYQPGNPMTFPYFSGNGERLTEPLELPHSTRADFLRPEAYVADPGLADAVNAALLLGQPLLLTGEPGTGKTQLAYYLAWELKLQLNEDAEGNTRDDIEPILKFETKSDSTAKSLFYSFDALKRFQHAQSGIAPPTVLPYITFNALGKAILFTREPDEVQQFIRYDFIHPGKRRSVVLVDEIDKAPRDFPNDILNEIDQLYFRVSELDNARIQVDPNLRPIIIMTSNSEKDLPDAFLRRCVFYHIDFPDINQMERIVTNRLGTYVEGNSRFLTDVLNLFYRLRERQQALTKKPTTAELLDWIVALRPGTEGTNPLAEHPERALETIGTLVKNRKDREKAQKIIVQWIEDRTS